MAEACIAHREPVSLSNNPVSVTSELVSRIHLRTRLFDVPPQDVISRDNVSVRVNAVVYYRVIDAEKADLTDILDQADRDYCSGA